MMSPVSRWRAPKHRILNTADRLSQGGLFFIDLIRPFGILTTKGGTLKIILGSSSIWRNRILQRIRDRHFPEFGFEVVVPDVDEKTFRSDDFWELTATLAARKLAAVRESVSGPALIVTSDQVVVCAGRLHEKPRDAAEARGFFISYRCTLAVGALAAVSVYNTETGRVACGHQEALVWFQEGALTDEAITELVADRTTLSCAGGIALGHGDFQERFVQSIEGERTCVMGLPEELTTELITHAMEDR